MENVPEVVVNMVLSNQSLRRLLKNSPHLFEVIETKKRLAKSHETSSPQPLKSKKRKVVKRGLEVSASSSQPIEVEEVIHLDAKETT